MKTLLRLTLVGLLLAGTAACGLRGDLEPAPPLYGRAKAEYEAEKAREAAEKARREAEKARPAAKADPAP